jgi:hypothetical protein
MTVLADRMTRGDICNRSPVLSCADSHYPETDSNYEQRQGTTGPLSVAAAHCKTQLKRGTTEPVPSSGMWAIYVCRHFARIYCLHLQGGKVNEVTGKKGACFLLVLLLHPVDVGSETSTSSLHAVTAQKTVIFIVSATGTSVQPGLLILIAVRFEVLTGVTEGRHEVVKLVQALSQAGSLRVRFLMNLESTQPLTEMSPSNLRGRKGWPVRKADNFAAIC